tara:strand:- start:559 stop:2016 length:1458 start_codon:yes stop_codon:yes gene_type:complete
MINEEGLRDWFGKSKSKDGKKGWVNVVTGDSCASDKPGEGIPKCVSSAKRASMSKKERKAAQAAKRREDPGQQSKSGASAPTMVKTDRKTRKEEMEVNEAKDKPGKGSGKKDACYHKVKSRYSVWPSAYASGALVKCRKKGAANWGNSTKKEEFLALPEFSEVQIKAMEANGIEVEVVEDCWDGYEKKGMKTMFGKRYPNCVKKKKTKKEEVEHLEEMPYQVMGSPDGKKEKKIGKPVKSRKYADARASELADTHKSTGGKYRSQYVEGKADGDPCWDTHKQVGMKKKGGKMVPNCVPKNEETQSEKDRILEGLTLGEGIERIPSETGKVYLVSFLWRGKYMMMKLFFPELKQPNKQQIQAAMDKVYPGSKVMRFDASMLDNKDTYIRVPDMSEETEIDGEIEEAAAWTKKSGKSESGGLNEKGRKSYERENPGSDLKAPSKKVGNPRRKSFCARMKGMKKKLTSSKTANDPDSRINKSLRAWNC